MFLKTIAHSWATSNLEWEEAKTQSLIQELDRKKDAVHVHIRAAKERYSRTIASHQRTRERELNAHIEFMNEQLSLAHDYLPDLKKLQSLLHKCVDSWIHLDLAQREIDIVSAKISSTASMIGLLETYVRELSILSQRKRRLRWRKLSSARESPVANDFVENEKFRIERNLKSGSREFESERKRLQSHRSTLIKQKNALYAERDELIERKGVAAKRHAANKEDLRARFRSCKEHWDRIAGRFAYHVLNDVKNKHVRKWMSDLPESGNMAEICRRAIFNAHSDFERAKGKADRASEKFKSLDGEFQALRDEFDVYRRRVREAHNSEEYSDSFSSDKDQRDRLYHQKQDAFELKQDAYDDYSKHNDCRNEIWEARKIVFDCRDELRRNIDRIRPLHPDSVIDALCEVLDAKSMKLERLPAFGIGTKEQRQEHWERKKKGIENAAGD